MCNVPRGEGLIVSFRGSEQDLGEGMDGEAVHECDDRAEVLGHLHSDSGRPRDCSPAGCSMSAGAAGAAYLGSGVRLEKQVHRMQAPTRPRTTRVQENIATKEMRPSSGPAMISWGVPRNPGPRGGSGNDTSWTYHFRWCLYRDACYLHSTFIVSSCLPPTRRSRPIGWPRCVRRGDRWGARVARNSLLSRSDPRRPRGFGGRLCAR